MTKIELISELSDICIRQAEIIKAQSYILEQLGAEAHKEDVLRELNRLREIVGTWDEYTAHY